MVDKRHISSTLVRRLLAAVLWIVVWELASLLVGSPLILASPFATAQALVELVSSASLWQALGFSLLRIGAGFAVAFVLALVLAFVASQSKLAEELIRVPLTLIKSVPIVCIIVILLMWIGSKNVSAVAAALVSLPLIYYASQEALSSLDMRYDELLWVQGVRGLRRLLGFVWPSSRPFIASAVRSACGMAWKAGVAAELIGVPLGSFGEKIYQSKILLETAHLFAWTILVVIAARIFEELVVRVIDASFDAARNVALHGSYQRSCSQYPQLKLEKLLLKRGGKELLAGADIALNASQRLCLLGASGAGKTSLMRVMAGLERVHAHEVSLPRYCSMEFQEERLIDELDALQNVRMITGSSCSIDSITAALTRVIPEEALTKPVSELSGGQRRRVELVRSLLAPSELVLLDEPFAALDDGSVELCCDFINEELGERILVFSTHNPAHAQMLHADVLSMDKV